MSAAQGLKYDNNKPDTALIPAAAILEEAAVWTHGKHKYAAFNWHKGINYMRILSAIGRHWALLNAGIDLDYETRRHHAAAIRCGCGMLIQFSLEQRTELDDRMILTDETKSLIEASAKGEMIWDLLKEATAA